jgi:Ca2+-transporting ATPase
MDTEMGRIASMVSSARSQVTPLEERLKALGKTILVACVAICLVLVVLGLMRGLPFHDMFLTGVSLAVAAVPEGLPAVVTLSFAFGVQRMARNGAIVRKLEAIETLGSVTVICSDKTGTLTKNRMEVALVAAPEDLLPGYGGRGASDSLRADILRVALLASDARHLPGEDASTGEDPTEQAIVLGALDAGVDASSLDARFPRIGENPFTPERRMMSVKVLTGEGALVCAKGASDTVIPVCRRQKLAGREVSLRPEDVATWDRWVEEKASRGMRVLAVAERREGAAARSDREYREDDLTLRGCLALADPLRPEAAPAVKECRRAGIRPVLITGDHLRTAESVARQAGILAEGETGTTGDALDRIPESRLAQAVDSFRVFARVSPAQKLRIVRGLKKSGHVVAMTGDGVNDAPALKEAAVGVAMGQTGTDVAREAGSMVLLDDNFSTIVKAVEEGRSIYENVRKFIRYLFSCNLGEVITMITAAVFGLPLPLTPAELLWMNLVTDGLPALALSRDPPESDIMTRPPRDPGEGLFSHGLWRRIAARGVYIGVITLVVFLWTLSSGDVDSASTMAYATLVTVQLAAAFDCRSEEKPVFRLGLFTNLSLVLACTLSWLMLFATIQFRPVASLFRTVPLTAAQWLLVFLVSVFPDLFRAAFSGREQ